MGWTHTRRRSDQSVEDFFRSEFGENVKDVALVGFTEAYIAYETPDDDVVCLVCLVDFQENARDGLNFRYKDLDETMGPGVHRCPSRILDQLTSTDHPGAQRWRERCRERLQRREAQPTLQEDDVVFFHHPITFKSGGRHDLFRVERRGRTNRKIRFRPMEGGRLCRIPKFRDKGWVRIESREDFLPLLQHDDSGVRERALAAMGRLDMDRPTGRTR